MKGFLQYLNEIQKTNKPLFLVICAVLAVFLYPIVSILGGVFGYLMKATGLWLHAKSAATSSLAEQVQ